MQLQVGDRFTDEEGEWEIATRPWTTHGGKTVHASVQKSGDPSTKRDKTWGAHERLAIRRPRCCSRPSTRSSRSTSTAASLAAA